MRAKIRQSDDPEAMEKWVENVSRELKATPDSWALTRNLRIEERLGLIEGDEDGCNRL